MAAKNGIIAPRATKIRQYYRALSDHASAPRQGPAVENRVHRGAPRSRSVLDVAKRAEDNSFPSQEHCQHCHSTALRVDWKQGDRVCTNCGVVAEEHLIDEGPEWREFDNEAGDGGKFVARTGFVPVDETRYIGGLQPTTLSKQPFGGVVGATGGDGYKLSNLRNRLVSTDAKLNRMTEKMHRRALEDARLDMSIQQKRIRERRKLSNGDEHEDYERDDDESSIRPEFSHLVLQEEEDAHRMHAALHSNKWSLSRAILLYGTPFEQQQLGDEVDEEKDFLSRMDNTLKVAAKDLYDSYSMVSNAARSLNLPERVLNDAVNRLVRYAARRDGFFVRGVSSRISSSSSDISCQGDKIIHGGNVGVIGKGKNKKNRLGERKVLVQRLREYNKLKQMGSLGSALLFLTSRNLGWTRSLGEVCTSFQLTGRNEDGTSFVDIAEAVAPEESFVKPKHLFRAMNEIKATFPEYARAMIMNDGGDLEEWQISQQTNATTQLTVAVGLHGSKTNDSAESLANFVDHSLRRLQLPPVAEASIRTLFAHCRTEQIQLGQHSGTKLSTLCASVAYFVCAAGAIMQRLAQQAKARSTASSRYVNANPISKRRSLLKRQLGGPSPSVEVASAKKAKTDCSSSHATSRTESIDSNPFSDRSRRIDKSACTGHAEDEPFDVFKHPVVHEEDQSEKQYEMRRMWDAWAEQMPWLRKVGEVEESCGVSRNVIMEFYKSNLYPRRKFLLQVLKDSASEETSSVEPRDSLRDAPFASLLLDYISTAAPLMSAKGSS